MGVINDGRVKDGRVQHIDGDELATMAGGIQDNQAIVDHVAAADPHTQYLLTDNAYNWFLSFSNIMIETNVVAATTEWSVLIDAAEYAVAFAGYSIVYLSLWGHCGVVGNTAQKQNSMVAHGQLVVATLPGAPTVGFNYDQEFQMFCQPYGGNVANGIVSQIYIKRSTDGNGDPIIMWAADRAFGQWFNNGWSITYQPMCVF